MILNLLGTAVAYGLFSWAMKLQAFRWRLLAAAYASHDRRPANAARHLQTFVMYGGGFGVTRYAGVTIGITDDGLALRMIPPFSMHAPALFLPFAEMSVRRTDWYLNAGSHALSMERVQGLDIIVDDDLLGWIQAHAGKLLKDLPGQE